MSATSEPRRVPVERGIHRNPRNGKYEFNYQGSDGKTKWKTVDGGLREARQLRADFVSRLARGERIAPTRKTFAVVADECMKRIAPTIRPRTLEIYESHLRNHVLPRLGRVRVAELTEDDVATMIRDLDGLSAWTVHGILTALSRVLGYAARRGYVTANVVHRLERGERPSIRQKEKRVLGHDEIRQLLTAATDLYRPLFSTATYTGARVSELLGLRWQDVDLAGGFVRVSGQLDRGRKRIEFTKTDTSRREIVLMPGLERVLRALRERQFALGQAKPTDLVFVTTVGSAHSQRNIGRALGQAVRRAGLADDAQPSITMHTFRDTFASHLILDLKLDVVQVSKQLGHARPSITYDTYARLFDQARHADDIRARMDESTFGKILESSGGDQWQTGGSAEDAKVAQLRGSATGGN